MSGIKENQEIRQVQQVNSTPIVKISYRIVENRLNPTVVENVSSTSRTILAPHLIKAVFNSLEKVTTNLSVAEVKKIASTTTIETISDVSYATVQSARQVAALVGKINSAQTVSEVHQTCLQIRTICFQEQMSVFKEGIIATVKTVMTEVGFSNISIRTIGITPVIISKNQQGQTIRTEVTEDTNNKIDLIRIQSGIPESECDALNKKINSAFQKYGLEYARFSKVSKAHRQNRTLSFTEDEGFDQNIQNINLKH